MESRLRIAGQAVQPVLVMFPLGLFTMAILFDIGNLLGGPDILGALAYWNIVAGLIGGVLAGLALAIDLVFVRNRTRAKRMGVLLVLCRWRRPCSAPGTAASWSTAAPPRRLPEPMPGTEVRDGAPSQGARETRGKHDG